MARPIYQIADEISADWKTPNFGAVPYLDAMRDLVDITDSYGADDGRSIVLYFLSNAKSWTGDVAKRIKAELKDILNGKTASTHVASQRTAAWSIDDARAVVSEMQYREIDGMILDLQTANLLTQVYDRLSPDNQAKFTSMSLDQASDVAWKMVTKTSILSTPVTAAWGADEPWDESRAPDCKMCGNKMTEEEVDRGGFGDICDECRSGSEGRYRVVDSEMGVARETDSIDQARMWLATGSPGTEIREDGIAIEKKSSRRTADAQDGPSDTSQSGYAETSLPQVEVLDNLDDISLGWATDSADQPPAAEADMAFQSMLSVTASTCSTCGSPIERDPEGETNRSWHHNDGSTHDHEAKPGKEGSVYGDDPEADDYWDRRTDEATCKTCGAQAGNLTFNDGAEPSYWCDAHTPDTGSFWPKQSSRRTASSCAECGAAIERDPEGESNRSWHHNDGSTHDHEARPGGDSKESSRRTAAMSTGYESGRAPGAEWTATCTVCGGTETGTDYYNGWPSQDAFIKHLFCGHDSSLNYNQDLAIDRMSRLTASDDSAGSICPYCDFHGTESEVAKHVEESGADHQKDGTVSDKANAKESVRRTAAEIPHDPSVPLWECPCFECTRLDYAALPDDSGEKRKGLDAWRRFNFPEVYGDDRTASRRTASSDDVQRGYTDGQAGSERFPGESYDWLCGYDAAVEGRPIEDAYQEAQAMLDKDEAMYGHDWHGWKESSRRATLPSGRPASRTASVSLTHVKFEGGIGSNIATGVDSQGKMVRFRLSDDDAKDLAAVMTSDMAVNFSGVDIEEADIIGDTVTAGRRSMASVSTTTVPKPGGGQTPYGRQSACGRCGMDIEYHGDGVWIGRGGEETCANSGAALPRDEDSVPIIDAYPDLPHSPDAKPVTASRRVMAEDGSIPPGATGQTPEMGWDDFSMFDPDEIDGQWRPPAGDSTPITGSRGIIPATPISTSVFDVL